MDLEKGLFFFLAALILGTAAMVAFRPRPIESALWLVLNFIFTAALYVLLGSEFIAIVQVIVYAGAIMVLFTFVILLLNLDPRELGTNAPLSWSSLVLLSGFTSFVLLSLSVLTPELMQNLPALTAKSSFGSVESISRSLLTDYFWAFELSGLILLLAIVGVGLLAYRKPKHSIPGGLTL